MPITYREMCKGVMSCIFISINIRGMGVWKMKNSWNFKPKQKKIEIGQKLSELEPFEFFGSLRPEHITLWTEKCH